MRRMRQQRSPVGMLVMCLMTTSSIAWATDYPSKPIRFIVPFPAGSVADIQVRPLAQKASHRLGQQVVVDNRAGAEGRIGIEALSKAPADGYTIGLGTIGTLVISPLVYAKIAYDPATAFAPVSRTTTAPMLIVVNSTVPATTLKEFIDLAKSKPGQLNFGGGNLFVRLLLEMFNATAATKIVHVPYQASNLAVIDLPAGRVQLMIETPPPFRIDVQTGKLRALAVADGRRYAQLPNVPTTAEAGLPGFEARTWFGVIAPRATPADIVRRWNAEINDALKLKELHDLLAVQGLEAAPGSPEQFAAFINDEHAKWSRVVGTSGIKLE